MELREKGQGLLLWSDVGTGKTFLAGCIANALMDRNIPALMTSFPKLIPVAFSGKNYRTDKGRKNMENAAGILRDESA